MLQKSTGQVYTQALFLSSECFEGSYGQDCLNNCSTTCGVLGTCDKVTGFCFGGCQAGWKGDMCETGKQYCSFVCISNVQNMQNTQIGNDNKTQHLFYEKQTGTFWYFISFI